MGRHLSIKYQLPILNPSNPKKTGGIRLITNLSSPINGSVNDFIDTSYTSVQYSSFDRAVVIIKKLGFKAQC
jgi:hypothetical protein